jgi:hypothetical protein
LVIACPFAEITTPDPSPLGVETLITAGPMRRACSFGLRSTGFTAVEYRVPELTAIDASPSSSTISST